MIASEISEEDRCCGKDIRLPATRERRAPLGRRTETLAPACRAKLNNSSAHYDLGAGGHAVTVDCHDSTPEAAFDATTGTTSNTGSHCFAGGHLQGISVGA
ncbi:MAG TPA: hypothetical protein VMQ50_09555 [Casimicrobiaceae bacterium]|nr:hypothetical protein [Casimicrobiaceae bacterium]